MSSTQSSPLFLAPGASGTIKVTFTVPAGAASGSTDSGNLYVETFNQALTYDGSSDVLAALPYSWTVDSRGTPAPRRPVT